MLTPSQIAEMAEKKYPYKSDNPVVMAATDTRRTTYIAALADAMELMSKEWVPITEVEKILESNRVTAMKTKSHSGVYAESIIYNIIEEVGSLLPEPPVIKQP